MPDQEQKTSTPAASPAQTSDVAPMVPQELDALFAGSVAGKTRMSMLHVLVGLNTLLVLVVVGAIAVMLASDGPAQTAVMTPPIRPIQQSPQQPQTPEPLLVEAASWASAEKLFSDRKYVKALWHYQRLCELAQSDPTEPTAGLMHLRAGQCLSSLGKQAEAAAEYSRAAQSRSAVVRSAATYWLGIMDATMGQHLRARMKAYGAIAELASLARPLPLESDCDFLAASCLSQALLAMYNSDATVDWPWQAWHDPFTGADEQSLANLLSDGPADAPATVLAPRITKSASGGWNVRCNQSSLDDLLHRLAAQANLDVRWDFVGPTARSRAVTLHVFGVSEQRAAELACGMSGLVARFTGEAIVVQDPHDGRLMSTQRDVLSQEANAAWRRFFLRRANDERVGLGHYVAGVLQECAQDGESAQREYHLVASRFPRDKAAPYALLRSGKLRLSLGDFSGAYTQLIELLDTYPSFGKADEIYLSLGMAAMNAGIYDQAVTAFVKLYYMHLSSGAQAMACFGAGKSHYAQGNFKDACTWLTRYVGLAGPTDENVAEAFILMGKSYAAAGNMLQASQAFRSALAARPSKDFHLEAVMELARTLAAAEMFAPALAELMSLDLSGRTPQQLCQYMLLVSRTYRGMHVPERAVAFLKKNRDLVSGAELRALLSVELARCLAQEGELEPAASVLSEALGSLAPGPEAFEGVCELAELRFKAGAKGQAVAMLEELVRSSSCPEDIRSKAKSLLGRAYLAQSDYARAVAALSPPAEVVNR